MSDFERQLFAGLKESFLRMGNPIPFREKRSPLGRLRGHLRAALLRWARSKSFYWLPRPERMFAEAEYIFAHAREFEEVRGWLADQASKDLLMEVLRLRTLGPYYVRPSLSTAEYWAAYESIQLNNVRQANSLRLDGCPPVNLYEIQSGPSRLRLHASPFGIMTTFHTEQYAYRVSPVEVCAGLDEVAIDGGGYLGETALYFGGRVGPKGRVVTFEFNQSTLEGLKANLRLNPDIERITRIVPRALWHTSGQVLSYQARGPGTTVREAGRGDGSEAQVTTLSIDDLVREEALPRVDFIKLDIEGAELGALQGAVNALREFRPNLAVSLYHKIQDFVEIPRFLNSLNLGYRFYLKHAYVDDTETLLFATARAANGLSS